MPASAKYLDRGSRPKPMVMMMSSLPVLQPPPTVPGDNFDAILRALWKYGEECEERIAAVAMPPAASKRLRMRIQICYEARVQLRATLAPPANPARLQPEAGSMPGEENHA
jgi:DNA-binding LacI/PurR family transcriptional regulator